MRECRILALDPAGLCGWAEDAADPAVERPLAGTWDVSRATYGSLGRALLAFEKRMQQQFLDHPFGMIVYEAPIPVGFHRGKKGPVTNAAAIRSLHARDGIIEKFAAEVGIEVYEVSAGEARRYFVGSGRAGKAEVWNSCKSFGWTEPGWTLDTSDAVAILMYARGVQGEVRILGKKLS